MKGEVSPVAVTRWTFTGLTCDNNEGWMFYINCLFNIVTLAPVSIKNAKHLFCSLAFTKSPSLLAQVSPLVSLVHGILVIIPIC
jgi:hypothetical protein